ncbi:MAG TPA: hypothetical protein VGM32_00895 [Rhodopila sp.]|jgi:hypothetical protein
MILASHVVPERGVPTTRMTEAKASGVTALAETTQRTDVPT